MNLQTLDSDRPQTQENRVPSWAGRSNLYTWKPGPGERITLDRRGAEMAARGLPGALGALLLLLLLAWEGAGAPALLPPAALQRLLGDLSSMMQRSREEMGQMEEGFETHVDFSKLPPNYHDEEKEERRVGNATVYSHREINKVTDNQTGETVFSEKTVTSIEQGDRHLLENWKGCMGDDDCRKDQFCSSSFVVSQCQECKAKDTVCQRDGECCLGYLCVWGKCTAGVSRGEGGTRCDPLQDECAPGLCCISYAFFPFPICAPYLTEGEVCQSLDGTLLSLMAWEGLGRSGQYCPCAQELMCRSNGFGMTSTCQRPEGNEDFGRLGQQLSFFQPSMVRRDEEVAYYDTNALPWQLQDAQMVVDTGHIKKPREELTDDYEGENLLLDKDTNNPDQLNFQELKQLANQMGQYFGPGFY
ncbi:dickkopf-like protein 1 isoform X1 [Alligator sinensis]|uniref:Dickkopf-like protein 1 isoform X1 n=2 Tax=Alligator sinensis TaxID=38654 RepID=A0A3Q0FXF7_ALLSI|nr:dickkopf-like protein 1 isoform X1 [Alligator sinensis]